MDKLVKINPNMGRLEYEMYQDIPNIEIGSENSLFQTTYDQFKKQIEQYIENEKVPDEKQYHSTTNRYIYYIDDYPIGEAGIRTSSNEFWKKKGSQVFYKIRRSERRKGYGTRMLSLILDECKQLNFDQVRINCDDKNNASKQVIMKNGGQVDIKQYQTANGTSSSYIIQLK